MVDFSIISYGFIGLSPSIKTAKAKIENNAK